MEHSYIVGQHDDSRIDLLLDQALTAIHEGHGVFFLDPHGHITGRLIQHIPEVRRQDVILFDPSDWKHPIAWNPLLTDMHHATVTSSVESAIKDNAKFGDTSTGVMSMHIRASIYPLIKAREPLLGFYLMLLSSDYRQQVLENLDDPLVKRHWSVFEDLSPKDKRQEIASTYNKAFAIFLDTRARNILGQRDSAFSMTDILKGKIFLARLPQGKLGKELTQAFGHLLLAQLHLSALSRTKFTPFHVYLADAHYFHGTTLSDMLATLGGYGVSITLSEPKPTANIVSYTSSKYIFRLSIEDTRIVDEHSHRPKHGVTQLYQLGHGLFRFSDGGDRPTVEEVEFDWPVYDDNYQKIQSNMRRNYARPEAAVSKETDRFIAKA